VSARYLVDTSVMSLLAPGRIDATPQFLEWIGRQDRNLFMSTVTATEIEQGIAKLRRAGGTARAEILTEWFTRVLAGFGDNAVPLDVGIARLAGQMVDNALAIGRPAGLADVLIAATAKSLGCVVLTRNLKHFEPLGVDCLDPLVTLPG